MAPRLKEKYSTEVVPALKEQLALANVNEVPRLEKIVVNMGVGAAVQDAKQLDAAIEDLRIITGQKPTITRAKKSIAGFKIRQGMPIGAKVTLRGDRMWEFFDRLLSTAHPAYPRLPRPATPTASTVAATTRWASTSSSSSPRSTTTRSTAVRGMDITFVTTAKTDEEAKALLDAFGFPFKR